MGCVESEHVPDIASGSHSGDVVAWSLKLRVTSPGRLDLDGYAGCGWLSIDEVHRMRFSLVSLGVKREQGEISLS